MNTGPGPVPASKKKSSTPDSRDDDCRERLIDATLELCAQHGYYATTPDQIAYAAGVEPSDFARYFASTEAVLLSIVDAMAHATAAALADVEKDVDPERALLSAGIAAMTAVIEDRGAVRLERLLAMGHIVNATRNLQRKVSEVRKRVITPALSHRLGVDPQDRRLKQALTMWSAVMASAYIAQEGMPDDYNPRHDSALTARMEANLSQSFGEVTGKDPEQSE
jgi:AcrR family transcriptional regulator